MFQATNQLAFENNFKVLKASNVRQRNLFKHSQKHSLPSFETWLAGKSLVNGGV
jgi:hypothetical protein